MGPSDYRIHQDVFTDFREASMMAQGRTFEFRKMDDAPFRRESCGLLGSDFELMRSTYSCSLMISGDNPSRLPSFGIPMNKTSRLRWHGKTIEGNSSLIFIPAGGEIHAVIDPGFDLFVLSCSEELLAGKMETMGIAAFPDRLDELTVLTCDPRQLDTLRRLMAHTTRDSLCCRPDFGDVRDRTLTKLVSILGSRFSRKLPVASSTKKRRAVAEVERYMLSHPDEAPRIGALCEITGVSRRTLDYAFNETYGVSPKWYTTALRLNAVHKMLRTFAPGSISVSDAANTWGFWHMGQFARDYRKLFGELPGETLGKVL